jgi:hypothetical protein
LKSYNVAFGEEHLHKPQISVRGRVVKELLRVRTGAADRDVETLPGRIRHKRQNIYRDHHQAQQPINATETTPFR